MPSFSRSRTGCRLARAVVLAGLVAPASPVGAQAVARPSAVADSQLFRCVDSLVAANPGFSGVVAIGRGGTVVHLAAAGAVAPGGARPTAETAFNLGSVNKLFTQIVVRQLAAEQGWSLDTTVAALWPQYPNAAVARAVTVRQLLTHRSGVQGNIFAGDSAARASLRTLRDFLPLFVNEPLQFTPGSRDAYSNAGYVLLGLLIEQRTQRSYFDVVAERIYGPAGMTRSAHWRRDSLPAFAARGTTQDAEPGVPPSAPRNNMATLPARGSSAGGGYASAADLVRFVQALRERRLPLAPPPGIGIAGGSPGVNAIIEGDLPGGRDVIVLANVDPPAAERVAQAIRRLLGATD
ncbi:MAG: serine hydrolase domain-containing protein [Gemmatimonas sp.]|jgi:D-alanyl-D-alanine carboxypeptidase|uniref:serine hydrolase domain-containing protein n=1 Tax=Gemmatimonas sp. TaxID=1962908 RepID=UPI0022BF6DEB|nr:serine hydrolase domain-containing protein [Gemmatimonas sp.]MCA2985701.1 beta-lactamase family protein [Gemmatimonas sp.]MCA2987603.1 beta-lactamase family protein [Gemmatimonas sp.]MCA2994587.1 beta-lactamase family protein [Gemmatimonas sp.]MCE2953351.1 beta-lactamase family protein [Gemmatimonas sp.]MCZ8011418.1 serine hydrolase [Gemmatimonas sp.]